MTTSFRAKFPTASLKNLRIFGKEALNPNEWGKREASVLKDGDIVVCFNPVNIADGAPAELEVAALILVFNTSDKTSPSGVLLTNDFYVIGSCDAILRERAVAASARSGIFSFLTVPHIGLMNEEGRKIMNGMQKWGSGGTRANPMHGLPDPLVTFLACLGVQIPPTPVIPIGVISQALVSGVYQQGIPDMSTKYGINMKTVSQPAISSVTVLEESPQAQEAPPASAAQAPTQAQGTPLASAAQAPTQAQETPPASAAQAPTQAQEEEEEEEAPAPEPIQSIPEAQQDTLAVTQGSRDSSAGTDTLMPDAPLQSTPSTSPTAPAWMTAKKDLPTRPDLPAGAPGQAAQAGGELSSQPESGFLSIRKRLEARLSGRLPRTGASHPGSPDLSGLGKTDSSSPVVKLVSNIRQQMSIASDNLEYRVSTLKSKMLDRLVSCKHNLGEKEQQSLKSLEDMRAQMQAKLESTAAQAKEELSKCASQGTVQVRTFQSRASSRLSELLTEQEKLISEKSEAAKRNVAETLSATKEELNKTVNRSQHTLRGLVTTTEVNLNQIVNQCGESMDERISGFRIQTQILAEGIGLSVESLGEAAKLQAQQSEDEVIKRLETLSEESLKSLREQSVKAEMECSKLIDKLSRDKLVPNLQEKRKMVVELSAFFHDEFSGAMQELLENKLSEFEPIVRSNVDFNTASLQDFTSRWTTNLEQHQKDMDETESRLREKVEEHLASAKSKVESMQDITKVTDHVLTSPELLRTREETCLKFDIVAREHVSKAYEISGDKLQEQKQESQESLKALRQERLELLRTRGEESRNRIRNAMKHAMHKIQELQARHTS